MSINETAANYLKNFEQMKRKTEQVNLKLAAPAAEVVHFEDTYNSDSNVIITRLTEPRFFAGVMKSGRVVWSHDEKLAKPVSSSLVSVYERRLGEELIPLWPYA